MDDGTQGAATAPSQAEVVVIAPRSSGLIRAVDRPDKDFPKVYEIGSLPPPDITLDDDPAEALSNLTLSSNVVERDRAIVAWRTAHLHQRDAMYWKETAGKEFARAERMLWQSSMAKTFLCASTGFIGMGIYERGWMILAATFFFLGLLFDQKVKRELNST